MACRGLILLSLLAAAHGAVQEEEGRANPIRKVVTMLQNMQKKVSAEGEKEKELFDKFMCYCKNADATLGKSIADAEAKMPEVGSQIEEGKAKKVQLQDEVKSAQTGRADAKDAIAKAEAIRAKENKAFNKESAEYSSNIAAMQSAISAISSGMSGAFVQTNTANIVRNIAMNGPNMEDMDRQEVLAFLSNKQNSEYVPKSGEITGILKTMEDEMSKTLAGITADETSSAGSHTQLIAAKTKEVNALTKAIEVKSKRVGELAVEIVMMKNDLSDTEAAHLEDKKFYGDLSKNCATKEDEWAKIQEMRALEMVALADTIKILNDDDTLELFKKTLPSAGASGFLQVSVSTAALREKALAVILKARKAPGATSELGFVEMALRGKKIGFEKVVKLIDNMVVQMKKEQLDDDAKKEYCTMQLDTVEDKKKGLEQTIADHETSIEDAKEGISTCTSELKALAAGIKALDKSVAEATEQRKEEHSDFTELSASDSAAKEILAFAKNRLNKFYNPKLYKAAPKRELSFVQVSAHSHDEPEAPPPAPKAFEKKDGGGVIAMIDLLIKDLDKELQTAAVDEKNAQNEYEDMMADSASKRAEDAKSITDKTGMKAQLETELEESVEGKSASTNELMATLEYTASLHKECDWLLKNFDVRKDARASEVDALGKAKAVLSGADFSLLQKTTKFLGRQ